MSTEDFRMRIGGYSIQVVRKEIKNLHLGVYPPNGRIRVAAPVALTDSAIRLAVIGKLGWIRRQRENFAGQARESPRELVSGESHYYLGRRYRLTVEQRNGPSSISLRGNSRIVVSIRPGTGKATRGRALDHWYRTRLRELAEPLLRRWEATLGVEVAAWGIKKMKTKWGSCNPLTGHVWLNLELIKKAPRCLEYVVAHELVHLRVRHHDERFISLMDRLLPRWRSSRAELNREPLAHVSWEY